VVLFGGAEKKSDQSVKTKRIRKLYTGADIPRRKTGAQRLVQQGWGQSLKTGGLWSGKGGGQQSHTRHKVAREYW